MVITETTRNRSVGFKTGPWVRIPPPPPLINEAKELEPSWFKSFCLCITYDILNTDHLYQVKAKIKMNKKIILSIITVCFLLTGCVKEGISQQIGQSSSASAMTGSAASSETAESQLKSVLAKYTTNQTVFFQSIAIGDNQNAAFAISGSDVWYITSSGAQKLKSGIGFPEDNQSNAPVLWTVGDTKIFKCEEMGGSSSMSYAWYVKDGKAVELPSTGMRLSYIGNGQFTTIGEAFDLGFTDGVGAGHTYKPYYLYWTTDGLKEYGGLNITQQQLSKVTGA